MIAVEAANSEIMVALQASAPYISNTALARWLILALMSQYASTTLGKVKFQASADT